MGGKKLANTATTKDAAIETKEDEPGEEPCQPVSEKVKTNLFTALTKNTSNKSLVIKLLFFMFLEATIPIGKLRFS